MSASSHSEDTPSVIPAYIELCNLTKAYGSAVVLQDISFTITEGEFVCFLGPSGCGKTTLLMCLAGLEYPSSGNIIKKGQSINDLPASERNVGIVFQSYALFPNLDVTHNIGFGLKNQNKPKKEIQVIVNQLISLLSLAGHEKKFPNQLSGGQQQRVALARALAVSPSLLLLDEPLSALDAQVRTRLRSEIRDLQKKLGITTIMVTHDQEEAQTLSDRIVVMNQGKIEQIGTPWEIYNQPRNPFVADFIGVSNMLSGFTTEADHIEVSGLRLQCGHYDFPSQHPIKALIRPEDILLSILTTHQPLETTSAQNVFQAIISKIEYLGSIIRMELVLINQITLKMEISKRTFKPDLLSMGTEVTVNIPAENIQLFAQ